MAHHSTRWRSFALQPPTIHLDALPCSASSTFPLPGKTENVTTEFLGLLELLICLIYFCDSARGHGWQSKCKWVEPTNQRGHVVQHNDMQGSRSATAAPYRSCRNKAGAMPVVKSACFCLWSKWLHTPFGLAQTTFSFYAKKTPYLEPPFSIQQKPPY